VFFGTMKPVQIVYEKFFSAWPSLAVGMFFNSSERCAPSWPITFRRSCSASAPIPALYKW